MSYSLLDTKLSAIFKFLLSKNNLTAQQKLCFAVFIQNTTSTLRRPVHLGFKPSTFEYRYRESVCGGLKHNNDNHATMYVTLSFWQQSIPEVMCYFT